MKSINNYISALLILTVSAVCSCADSTISDLLFASDFGYGKQLSLSTSSIEVDSHRQSCEFSLTASDDLDWYFDNIPSWITLSHDKGVGSISSISIQFKENIGAERSDSIMIKLSDPRYSGYITLQIKQLAPPEPQYVDLGLSVNWATFNVGATKPEEYGDYFAWGEVETYYESGYAQENPLTHWKEGKSAGYDWKDYRFWEVSDDDKLTVLKYNTDSKLGPVDNKTVLDPEDDIAHVRWGGDWRMPTRTELYELLDNCSWIWYSAGNSFFDGVAGYKVTSRVDGYTDNYIFLPAAGSRDGINIEYLRNKYWSSTLDSLYVVPYALYFMGFENLMLATWNNYSGMSVRPVCPSTGYLSVIASIELSQSELNMTTGSAPVRLTATARNNYGDEIQKEFQWISSDNNVATVSDDGTVTVVGAGTCIISAVTGSFRSDCIVNVTDIEDLSQIVSGDITVSVNDYYSGIRREVAEPRIVVDPADPGNRCIVVTTNSGYSNNYDAQLFIQWNEEIESGDTILFTMRYKADIPQSSNTEVHISPQEYIYHGLLPSISFSTEWQEYVHEMVVYDPARTFVFDLSYLKSGNNCYFDDISFKILSKGKSADPEGAEVTFEGVTYRIYKEVPDPSIRYALPDGVQVIKARLKMDVIDGGSSDTYVLGDNLYFREDGNSYSCMVLDTDKREIVVFALSYILGVNYSMNGYAYVSSIDDISFSREIVFSSANWGWWSYFAETADGYVLRHLSFDGNNVMESRRYGVNSWSNMITTSSSSSKAAINRFENGRALVCGQRQPVMPEYVDLGLSVKWATFNVGATKPEEYGDYYAWGETETKTTYDWSIYKWCNGSSSTLTKYNTSSSYGTVDNKTYLDLEDDVAHVKWGGSWHIPTNEEYQELKDNCTWIWYSSGNTEFNGVAGYKVTSNKSGYTDRFIFLPAAGFRLFNSLHDDGFISYYWSSSINTVDPYYARFLGINSEVHNTFDTGGERYLGFPVRPVCP